jgi:hypothetical protein
MKKKAVRLSDLNIGDKFSPNKSIWSDYRGEVVKRNKDGMIRVKIFYTNSINHLVLDWPASKTVYKK